MPTATTDVLFRRLGDSAVCVTSGQVTLSRFIKWVTSTKSPSQTGRRASGVRVAIGGKRADRPGAFMQPTILTDIERDNPAYKEQFFGPVALFFRVRDQDEAVALANDSPFGLGGSLFTNDIERGKRVASRIETGMVFVNHPTWTAPDLARIHRLRTRALQPRHPGVREQEADPRRPDRRARLGNANAAGIR
jgi:hypothetical protein